MDGLEQSLNAIVARHEVLRTTFAVVDDAWLQFDLTLYAAKRIYVVQNCSYRTRLICSP